MTQVLQDTVTTGYWAADYRATQDTGLQDTGAIVYKSCKDTGAVVCKSCKYTGATYMIQGHMMLGLLICVYGYLTITRLFTLWG